MHAKETYMLVVNSSCHLAIHRPLDTWKKRALCREVCSDVKHEAHLTCERCPVGGNDLVHQAAVAAHDAHQLPTGQ